MQVKNAFILTINRASKYIGLIAAHGCAGAA